MIKPSNNVLGQVQNHVFRFILPYITFFLLLFLPISFKNLDNSIFGPSFGVSITRTLVKIHNINIHTLDSYFSQLLLQILPLPNFLFFISILSKIYKADAKSTPFYSSDLHFSVFQNRPDRGALVNMFEIMFKKFLK